MLDPAQELMELSLETRQLSAYIGNGKDSNMKITLCDENLGHVSVHVEASVKDGELLISGQDFGSLVGEIFKDSDYEYFYSFNKENTKKLLETLKPDAETDELLSLLADRFSGVDGCSLLRKHCEDKRIDYKFNSF